MRTKMFSALAVLTVSAACGAAWAFAGPTFNAPTPVTTESQPQVAETAYGCCVTGDCCCPGAGSCCDPALRVTGEAAKSLKRAAGCCSTGNCCCPGAGSCCAPEAASTAPSTGERKPACCTKSE